MSVHRLAKTRFAIGVVSLTAIAAVTWLVMWASIVPLVRGWSPVAVISGSMAPRIESGDVVVAAPYGGQRLDPGAVIVFDNPAGTGTVTHRIVDTTPTGDYVTRGDANGHIDSTPVPPDAIHGVGRILVPIIGTPFVWANHNKLVHLIAAAIVAVAALWASRWALLTRYNPWRHRPPPLRSSLDTIGALLGVWLTTPQPAVVAQTTSAAPPTPTRARRGPRRLAITTTTIAFAVSAALVAPPMIQAQAAFTSISDNTGNSWTGDTLDPPTSLTATPNGADIDLDWTATGDTYATGHRILRSTSPGGPYTQIAEITPRTTVTHTDSPAAGTYYYVARAYYLSWESVNSNEASATATASLGPVHDSNSSWTGSGAIESWPHTIGSGSNRILIVTTATKDDQANSVTFNGLPMTLIGRQIDPDDASRISMWYLVNPATGPGTVQVTFSGIGASTMGASSWYGVHQSTPIGTFSSQGGESTTPSITVSSDLDEVVVDAVSNSDALSLTVDPSQDEHWNAQLGDVVGGHSSEAGAASVTMSWTMANDFWAIGAVPLKPA